MDQTIRVTGYEPSLFLGHIDDKHQCPICLMVLRSPLQTGCGHRFCMACIQNWFSNASSRECPVCKNGLTSSQIFPDNFAKREILQLKIQCPNKDHGCKKQLELIDLETHLGECEFSPCQNDCGMIVPKAQMPKHLKEECPNRKVQCKFCNSEVLFKNRKTHLHEECPARKRPCPYCQKEVAANKIAIHKETECGKHIVPCPLSVHGCKEQVPFKEKVKHMEEQHVQHMLLLSTAISEFSRKLYIPPSSGLNSSRGIPTELSDTLTSADSGLSLTTMSSTDSGISRGLSLTSAPQSDPTNYSKSERFLSSLDPEVFSSSLDYMMNSSKQLSTKVLQQQQTIKEMQAKQEASDSQNRDLWNKVRKLEQMVDVLSEKSCHGEYVWRIPEFSKRRQDAAARGPNVLHSPGFYTSVSGYKLCVRLNPNGVETAVGKHLALFVHFMKGDNDDFLKWPFKGNIIMAIMDQSDQREKKQNISEDLIANKDLAAFHKPVSMRNHKGFGYIEFVSLDIIKEGTYLKDDTLVVKVSVHDHSDARV